MTDSKIFEGDLNDALDHTAKVMLAEAEKSGDMTELTRAFAAVVKYAEARGSLKPPAEEKGESKFAALRSQLAGDAPKGGTHRSKGASRTAARATTTAAAADDPDA